MNDFARSVVAALSLIGRLDAELLGIVVLSLRVSLSASLIALVLGAPFGAWLAIARFPGRHAIIVLTNALDVPTRTSYVMAIVTRRNGRPPRASPPCREVWRHRSARRFRACC
jgi:ABC-type tungstate transport system substrate-binding protein